MAAGGGLTHSDSPAAFRIADRLHGYLLPMSRHHRPEQRGRRSLRERLDAFPTQLCLAIVWVLLVIPSLIFWSSSILWVIFVSLYANVATHFGAHVAWRAKRAAEHPADAEEGIATPPSFADSDLATAMKRLEDKVDRLGARDLVGAR